MKKILHFINNYCKHSILFLLILFISPPAISANADTFMLSPQAKVFILTFSPGDHAYSVFGHTALRVTDPFADIDFVYNFGTFNFNEKGFYRDFILGNLDYSLSREDFQAVLMDMVLENRYIFEQEINFSQSQKQILFTKLEINYRPDNRIYRYRFIRDNCSTRVRDMILQTAGSCLQFDSSGFEPTPYRLLINSCLEDRPWLKLGINLLLGKEAGKNSTFTGKMFLPEFLENEFAQAQILCKGHKTSFTSPPKVIFTASPDKISHTNFITPVFIFSLIIILYIVFLALMADFRLSTWPSIIIFCTSGILGLFILAISLFSHHQELHENYNLLWLNPLNLAVTVIMPFKKNRISRLYHIAYFLILVFALLFARQIHLSLTDGMRQIILLIMIANLHLLVKSKIVSLSENPKW